MKHDQPFGKKTRQFLALLPAVFLALVTTVSEVGADDDHHQFKARLQGFNEVPAVSSTGRGEFTARIRGDASIGS
jgi:hypothetical protein